MTKSEFTELIENHGDIMMHCGDVHFTIMTCYDDLLVGQQGQKAETFKTLDDMLKKYNISNKKIEDCLEELVLDDCS